MKNKTLRKQNTSKGITLIALVITIVVMLILVGVTITMAINGGLFTHAGKATSDTRNAVNAEQNLAAGGVTIGNTYYNSIDEYLKGTRKLITFTIEGKQFSVEEGTTWREWVLSYTTYEELSDLQKQILDEDCVPVISAMGITGEYISTVDSDHLFDNALSASDVISAGDYYAAMIVEG